MGAIYTIWLPYMWHLGMCNKQGERGTWRNEGEGEGAESFLLTLSAMLNIFLINTVTMSHGDTWEREFQAQTATVQSEEAARTE